MYETYSGTSSEATEYKEPINRVKHPWRRFFARSFDLYIYSIMITALELMVLRVDTSGKPLIGIFETLFACLIMVVVEPALLSSIGTTPGKWIFGLVVRNANGQKLTYTEGLGRTLGVFSEGMGFSIPIYNLVRQYQSYKICDSGEELAWDDGFSYHIKDTSGFRILGYFVGWGALFGMILLIVSWASLPVNRGNISVEEYYENCNEFMKYNELDFGQVLTTDGTWEDDNDYVIYYTESELPTHDVIYKDGRIEKVIVELEVEGDKPIYNLNNHIAMAYSSFVGSDKSVSAMSLFSKGVVDQINNSFRDFEFDIADIRVSNQVEIKGYHISDRYLFPIENEEQYFHIVFTMERIN